MLFKVKPMLSCWYLCLFNLQPMFVRWSLYVCHCKTNAFFLWLLCFLFYKKDMFVLLVPMFFNVKPMLCCWFLRFSHTENQCLFRWFLCFSQSNHCFFVCSYALQHKTIVFSLVPVCFTIKPMLCRSFLCVVFFSY